jgi:hypothetical protein
MKLSKKELERDRQLARGNGFQFKVTAPPQKPHGRVKPEFYFRTEAAAQIWIRTELKGKGTLTLDGGGTEGDGATASAVSCNGSSPRLPKQTRRSQFKTKTISAEGPLQLAGD